MIDRFGLRLADGRSSLVEDGAYSGLELWRFLRLRYFVDSLSSGSTLGKAALFDSGLKTEFAGFDTVIVLHRNGAIYILKNMLPLFLLALVVFATLFFPETMFRERVTIPVTAILTSAVLLLAVDNQLGDVGYTVAVEQIFYVFFALCLLVMLAGFGHERLRQPAGRVCAPSWIVSPSSSMSERRSPPPPCSGGDMPYKSALLEWSQASRLHRLVHSNPAATAPVRARAGAATGWSRR